MVVPFLKIPFASSGDLTPVPQTVQGDGSVSYPQGFGPDYELDPAAAGVLYPERRKTNQILNDITTVLNQWQTQAFPDFITTTANGGSPYSYGIHAYVRYDPGTGPLVYESIKTANVDLPTVTTSWRVVAPATGITTGMCLPYEAAVLPDGVASSSASASGYIWPDGKTIGDASSGATGRANADTQALFLMTWTTYPQAVRPLQNASGTVVARGASAAADWAAHRRIPVRDMREVVPAGWGQMNGGASPGLLDGYRQGVNGSVNGSTGGEDHHTPITGETAAHTHDQGYEVGVQTGNNPNPNRFYARGNQGTTGVSIRAMGGGADGTISEGGGQDFNVTQPTTIIPYILKL